MAYFIEKKAYFGPFPETDAAASIAKSTQLNLVPKSNYK